MVWCAVYLVVAILVATASFATANWFRTEDVNAPDSSVAVSLLAGALWPIVIIGITELAVTAWLVPGRSTS